MIIIHTLYIHWYRRAGASTSTAASGSGSEPYVVISHVMKKPFVTTFSFLWGICSYQASYSVQMPHNIGNVVQSDGVMLQ